MELSRRLDAYAQREDGCVMAQLAQHAYVIPEIPIPAPSHTLLPAAHTALSNFRADCAYCECKKAAFALLDHGQSA